MLLLAECADPRLASGLVLHFIIFKVSLSLVLEMIYYVIEEDQHYILTQCES